MVTIRLERGDLVVAERVRGGYVVRDIRHGGEFFASDEVTEV